MASLNPRQMLGRLAGRAMNLPTGLAERHLPLAIAEQLGRLTGAGLERSLAGRTVLVTGASSGIGEAAALMLGTAGGRVLLVARNEEKLGDLAARIAEHGGEAHAHPTDLADPAELRRLTSEVLEQHGGVDILINNAGRSIRRSVKLSYEREHDFQRTIELNYLAPVRLVLGFLPEMRERGSGHVINVSSASVQVRTPRFAAYTASKAALDAFTECAAAELVGDGIRFTTISMPLVRTPMIEPTAIYRNFPSLSPEQAAERISTAIVHRPRRIGTPFTDLAALIEAIDPIAMEGLRSRGYRRFPESGSPASETGGAEGRTARAPADEGSDDATGNSAPTA